MSADDKLQLGRRIQRELKGEKAAESADEFTVDQVRMSLEQVWAGVWGREGLSRRDRSLLTLGILAGLSRSREFGVHVDIGLRNGLTVDELREVCIQIKSYCGGPVGAECMRISRAVLLEHGHKFEPREL